MDATNAAKVASLYRALTELQEATDPELTVRQARALLYVGSQTVPVDQQDCGHRLKEDKGYMSRIFKRLGGIAGDVKREDGLGVITIDLDPSDFRRRLISLSKDGDRILKRVIAKL